VNSFDAARRYRAGLCHVTFIAVTGSCGKTTTKDLIEQVLADRYRGAKSAGSYNCGADLATSMLTVRPEDEFFTQELGAWGPGTIEQGIELVRPHIAVVTNLRNDHFSAFRGPLGAQAEKGKLVASLQATGTAVLNWDDSLVRELAGWTRARVFPIGCGDEAELRAVGVSSRWPQRLSFDVLYGTQRIRVQTRLVGEHLLGSALAALAVGLVLDMPLSQAVAALETAEPTPRRMSVAPSGDVVFIRDDFKAPADSLPEVLHFMNEAVARRKVGVFGRISDYPGRSRRTYTNIALRAITALDMVVFVGERAADLWAEPDGTGSGQQGLRQLLGLRGTSSATVRVFRTVEQATRFLAGYLQAGDLVLLKGSGPTDHLERILLSRERQVSCWLAHCGRINSCDECELLTAAVAEPVRVPPPVTG
jgi:UDP-N-acetylmuramoyl-tripeptide--D-alanyl-D-alanine ligase